MDVFLICLVGKFRLDHSEYIYIIYVLWMFPVALPGRRLKVLIRMETPDDVSSKLMSHVVKMLSDGDWPQMTCL